MQSQAQSQPQQLRKLALHASALSDAEYAVYTTSIKEIVLGDEDGARDYQGEEDDGYFAQMQMGVREARGWLRGRYSSVSSGIIDNILKLFSPTLAPGDTLSGAEFFAALRLVVHAQTGATEIDRSLAFVQADPSSTYSTARSTPSGSRAHSPSKRSRLDLPPPPPKPFRRQSSISAVSTSSSRGNMPIPPPLPSPNNPFSSQQPPLHPSQRSDTASVASGSSVSQVQENPFSRVYPAHPRSDDGATLPPLPPRKAPSVLSVPTSPSQSQPRYSSVPPPPPRPRQRQDRSISPTKVISLTSNLTPTIMTTSAAGLGVRTAPAPPPKPAHHHHSQHVTSTLMKQSLQASHVGASLQRAGAMLEKERVMQVLRSSSSTAVPTTSSHSAAQAQPAAYASSASASSEDHSGAPPLPQRKSARGVPPPPPGQGSKPRMAVYRNRDSDRDNEPRQQPSPPMSTSSLEQVALASVSLSSSPKKDAPRPPQRRRDTERPRRVDDMQGQSAADLEDEAAYTGEFAAGPPPMHPDRSAGRYGPMGLGRREANLESFEAVYGPMGDSSFPSSSSNLNSYPNPTQDPSASSPFSPISPTPGSPSTPTAGTPPNPRVFRSRSMHHPSPTSSAGVTSPPPPPARRKRPESVQVLPAGGSSSGIFGGGYPALGLGRNTNLLSTPGHRRSSLSTSSTPGSFSQQAADPFTRDAAGTSSSTTAHGGMSNPMANIQRTFAGLALQPTLDRAREGLDKARYKAEAGLSRRGFVRHDGAQESDGGSREREETEGLFDGDGVGRPRARSKGKKSAADLKYAEGEDPGQGYGYGYELEREWDSDDDGHASPSRSDPATTLRPSMRRQHTARADDKPSGDEYELASDYDDYDNEASGRGGTFRGRGGGRAGASGGLEKDNLKWPAGDGWNPL